MSKNSEYRTRSFLKQRLGDYEHPVGDDLWAAIESALPARPKRRFRPAVLITSLGGAAAAIVALVLILSHPFSNPVQPLADNTDISGHQGDIAEILPSPEYEFEFEPLSQPESSARRSNGIIPVETIETASTPIPELKLEPEPVPDSTGDAMANETPTQAEAAPAKQSTGIAWGSWSEQRPLKRQGRNLSFALAVNSSFNSSFSSQKSESMLNDLLSSVADPPGSGGKIASGSDYTGITSHAPSETTKAKYDFPVTAAAMLRYGLTKRFALETGLSYTMLSAKTDDASYKLHYLGIPLRASVSIFDNSLVSLYASAGPTGEKLVSGREKSPGSSSGISTQKILWSVSGAAGVNFKLTRNWWLYFEPGVAYYFDDKVDAPTIRRDKPLNFNLQLGVRIDLK